MIPNPTNHPAAQRPLCTAKGAVERVAAQVVAVDREGLWIEVVEPRGGCGRCFEPGGCGALSLSHGRAPHRFWFSHAHCQGPLRVGDLVWVETEAGAPLKTAWHTYGLPLLFALVGAEAGHYFGADLLTPGQADALSMAVFVAVLLAGWWRAARRLAPAVRIAPRTLP